MDKESMLVDFDEFVNFCFEHGGTLRNHKAFGEMAQKLRTSIKSAQQNRVSGETNIPAENTEALNDIAGLIVDLHKSSRR